MHCSIEPCNSGGPGITKWSTKAKAHSGTTAEGRLGLQRLLAEVSLNQVGIILGTEMGRIAGPNKDGRQLIEVCGIFRNLLAGDDGLYDSTDDNDRHPTVAPA